jgi:hypothetical protein
MTKFKIQDIIKKYGFQTIRIFGEGDMLVIDYPIYHIEVDNIEYCILRWTDTTIRIFPVANWDVVGARTHTFDEFNSLVESGDYKIQFVLDSA